MHDVTSDDTSPPTTKESRRRAESLPNLPPAIANQHGSSTPVWMCGWSDARGSTMRLDLPAGSNAPNHSSPSIVRSAATTPSVTTQLRFFLSIR
jgi:hypothetical protein